MVAAAITGATIYNTTSFYQVKPIALGHILILS